MGRSAAVASQDLNAGWRALVFPAVVELIWILANLGAITAAAHFSFPTDSAPEHLRRIISVRRAWFESPMFLAICYVVFGISFWMSLRKCDLNKPDYFRHFRTRYVVLGAVVGAALGCSAAGAQLLLDALVHAGTSTVTAREALQSEWPKVAAGLPVALVIAPFVEELYFRGALLHWLRNRMSVAWSVLICTVAFVLFHVPKMHASNWLTIIGAVTVFGVISGIGTVRTRSLWFSVVLHASYNAGIWFISYAWLFRLLP